MKNKLVYIGLSLIIPGAGQLLAKRYVRGTVQLFGSLGAVLWLAAEVILPFIRFYAGDPVNSKFPVPDFVTALRPIVLFLALFAWSIIDLMLIGGSPSGETEKKE
ncbi:MAG: hypothetical protein PHH77_03675 [Victivallaceae bacterium]|nr:hypothetical protein [Victivallaceae bacterium]